MPYPGAHRPSILDCIDRRTSWPVASRLRCVVRKPRGVGPHCQPTAVRERRTEAYTGGRYGLGMTAEQAKGSVWTVHGERVVDDTRRAVLSIADVELPDGVRFEQYVLRVPKAAIVVVVDDEQRV